MSTILLVVLYKETITSSTTISSLLKNKCLTDDVLLVLWDNSPQAMKQEELDILGENHVTYNYIHSKENTSLSKLYNEVIDRYYSKTSKILIFDQDSYIGKEYFALTEQALAENPDIDLFLPYVMQNGKVISPNEYKVAINYKYFSKRPIGRVKAKNGIAFGSGMCLRSTLFTNKNLRFDENLSFYGVDYKFVLDYGNCYDYFYVIDYALEHDLSLMKIEDVEVKKARFNSNCYAYLYLANSRLNIFNKSLSIIRLFIDTLMLSFKYKNSGFISIFWNNLKSIQF